MSTERAERAYLSPSTVEATPHTANSLDGDGRGVTSAWVAGSSVSVVNIPDTVHSAGVDVRYPGPEASVSLFRRTNGSNPSQLGNSNIWITPMTFTALLPGCG